MAENPERMERRNKRVKLKLQEMEGQEENKENEGQQTTFEMIEFAEKYFNNHEKSPEGIILFISD